MALVDLHGMALIDALSKGTRSCVDCGATDIEVLRITQKRPSDARKNLYVPMHHGANASETWLKRAVLRCTGCIAKKHHDLAHYPHDGILSGRAIHWAIEHGAIEVTPYQQGHLNPASLDLTLGAGVYEYVLDDAERVLDAAHPPKGVHYAIPPNGIVLRPDRAYLMHTAEIIHTNRYVPVIDGKSSLGRLFVSVHETAGFVDPGFRGNITLEVSVKLPVRLYAGMRVCQVRFHTICGPIDLYGKATGGHYVGKQAEGVVPSAAHRQVAESRTRRQEPRR